MGYSLNSAVITAPGLYRYALVTEEEARRWWAQGPVVSTIGYAETAAALSEMLGVTVQVDRRTVTMEPEDEALVFRLVLPPGAARIDPRDKGRLGEILRSGAIEIGLLRRVDQGEQWVAAAYGPPVREESR
jgi:hypothetical protein